MTLAQYLALCGTLIGGGAMGAILNNFFHNRRSRRQPIAYKIEMAEIFKQIPKAPSVEIVAKYENKIYPFDNLIAARITLINKGNQDIPSFDFGMTMGDKDLAVGFQSDTPDRHHKVLQHGHIGLNNPAQRFDLTLEPFNRDDVYYFDITFTYPKNHFSPGEIKLSSAHSIKFVEMTSIFEVGPLKQQFGVEIDLPALIQKLIRLGN